MDFTVLQMFKAVVEEGGISAAARKLHRVQSNVTTRIKQLETSLGTQLFIREKRRLVLSPSGEMFRTYVDQLLRLSEDVRAAISGDVPRGVLRIGTLESTAASRLPPLLSAYHEKYPGVRLELTTGTNDALLERVFRRQVDGAFVVECADSGQVDIIPTFDEELVIVAHRSHRRIRGIGDVHADSIISFPHGCAYRRKLQAWFGTQEFAPDRILEVGSYHAILACVASGTGVALMPRSVLNTFRDTENVRAYSMGRQDNRVTTCFVSRRGQVSLPLKALRMQLLALRGRGRPARNARPAHKEK